MALRNLSSDAHVRFAGREIAPDSVHDIGLILAGKVLNKRTLEESKITFGHEPGEVITVHAVVQPETEKKKKKRMTGLFVLYFSLLHSHLCQLCPKIGFYHLPFHIISLFFHLCYISVQLHKTIRGVRVQSSSPGRP